MKDFLMLFRSEPQENPPSPEQLQAMLKEWEKWHAELEKNGQFVASEALNYSGRQLAPDGSVTDGPYAELKELVGGFTWVKAVDLDQAFELAKSCPMHMMGGHIEVREFEVFDY